MYKGSSVEYIDHMGSDLHVVNDARVSFDKESNWDPNGGLKKADENLIRFLARGMSTPDFDKFVAEVINISNPKEVNDVELPINKQLLIDKLWDWRKTPCHFSPFAHNAIKFRIEAPMVVARQLVKHQVGGVWNEVSRRYVDSAPEFYKVEGWRKRAADKKQGSSEELVDVDSLDWMGDNEDHGNGYSLRNRIREHILESSDLYEAMLNAGICPEQVRGILPQFMMTKWVWTGSLFFWANVCNQRLDPHAQFETREVAQKISDIMKGLFPVSWDALVIHS